VRQLHLRGGGGGGALADTAVAPAAPHRRRRALALGQLSLHVAAAAAAALGRFAAALQLPLAPLGGGEALLQLLNLAPPLPQLTLEALERRRHVLVRLLEHLRPVDRGVELRLPAGDAARPRHLPASRYMLIL
jgi:hypothetical protein